MTYSREDADRTLLFPRLACHFPETICFIYYGSPTYTLDRPGRDVVLEIIFKAQNNELLVYSYFFTILIGGSPSLNTILILDLFLIPIPYPRSKCLKTLPLAVQLGYYFVESSLMYFIYVTQVHFNLFDMHLTNKFTFSS